MEARIQLLVALSITIALTLQGCSSYALENKKSVHRAHCKSVHGEMQFDCEGDDSFCENQKKECHAKQREKENDRKDAAKTSSLSEVNAVHQHMSDGQRSEPLGIPGKSGFAPRELYTERPGKVKSRNFMIRAANAD
eukprot:TRINITY_DN24961_c0_g2_i1.p1 TRINITY_DN24961_c0_g2~~TRINITY_DN24961_c0_g2_i1.p1  ORF type:complete len:137 (+),score=16.83 TRINITY_DN24961_c0_g2_i1:67-477(+)